jgi:MFS transporter, DHA2 family, methylenomycin A resistance protein
LGFFVITLDAVVVNVALPAMDLEQSAGVTGLQWIVDGYTLMFAIFAATAAVVSATALYHVTAAAANRR